MWWVVLVLGCGAEIVDTGEPEPEPGCVAASPAVQAELDEAVHAYLVDGDEAVLDGVEGEWADLCFDAWAAAIRAWPGDPVVATEEPVELTYDLPLLEMTGTAFAWVPLSAEGQERVPLVVWLYGSGGDARHEVGNPPIRDAVAPREAMLLVPTAVACDWSAHDACAQQVFAAIDAAKATWPIDHDRVYLTGHSMGGRGSLTDGLVWPDRFAGIVPVAGSISAIAGTLDPDVHEEILYPHVENALHLRTRMMTGLQDVDYLVLQNEVAASLFEDFGYDFVWDAFEDLGHGMPWNEWTTALHWAMEATRDPYPDHVIDNMARHVSSHYDYLYMNREIGAAVWWVRMDARGDDLAPARVEGTVDGQAIALTTDNVAELSVYLADELVDLDQPVSIAVDGETWFEGSVERDHATALEYARDHSERSRVFAARITGAVP